MSCVGWAGSKGARSAGGGLVGFAPLFRNFGRRANSCSPISIPPIRVVDDVSVPEPAHRRDRGDRRGLSQKRLPAGSSTLRYHRNYMDLRMLTFATPCCVLVLRSLHTPRLLTWSTTLDDAAFGVATELLKTLDGFPGLALGHRRRTADCYVRGVSALAAEPEHRKQLVL